MVGQIKSEGGEKEAGRREWKIRRNLRSRERTTGKGRGKIYYVGDFRIAEKRGDSKYKNLISNTRA